MIKFENEPPGGFYATLRQRGEKYLAEASESPRYFLFGKAVLLVAAYFFCFWNVLFGENLWFWYALTGFFTVPWFKMPDEAINWKYVFKKKP